MGEAAHTSTASQTDIDFGNDEAFFAAFNDLIVSTFHSIERYEELSLKSFESNDLSIAESHLVEAVGRVCQDNPAASR